MRMPLLMVTERSGACGKTNRVGKPGGSASSGTMGTKSLPSAPSPCSQMTLAVGLGAVSSSIPGSKSAVMMRAIGPAGRPAA